MQRLPTNATKLVIFTAEYPFVFTMLNWGTYRPDKEKNEYEEIITGHALFSKMHE